MADETVVERHVVALGFRTDMSSLRTAKMAMSSFVLGVAAGTAAAAAFVVGQAAVDDELTKTAHSLGITTEAYTALTYAMDREGVSTQQLGGSLRYLQTQLEAASRNTGEAKAWLDRMGISATDAAGNIRLASDVLPELADELAKLPEGDRLSASLRTLGESGQRMGTALAKGGDNLRALLIDAERLGYVLDEETAKDAEALTDSMTRLSAVTTGLGREFARELTPATKDVVDQMTDFLAAEDGIVRVGIRAAAEAMGLGFRALSTDAGLASAAILTIGAATQLPALAAGVPILGGIATAVGSISAPAVLATAALVGAVLVVDDLATAADGGDSAIMRMAESMGYGEELADALTEANTRAAGSYDLLGAASTTGTQVLWEATKPWRKLGEGMAYVSTIGEDVRAWIWTMNPLLQAFSKYWMAVGRAIGWAVDKLTDFEALGATVKSFGDDVESGGFASALGGLAMSGVRNLASAGVGLSQGTRARLNGDVQDVANLGSSEDPSAQYATSPVTVSAPVSIVAGASGEEVADAAAQAVRTEILQGYSALPLAGR